MKVDLGDLNAFVAVARAKGFRDGARTSGASASGLSEAEQAQMLEGVAAIEVAVQTMVTVVDGIGNEDRGS